MKKFLFAVALVAAILAAGSAQAAMMSGGLSLVSSPGGPDQNGVLPVNGTVLSGLSTATGLDFTLNGSLTPGVSGQFYVVSTNLSFGTLFHQLGNIRDFTFDNTGGPYAGYPGTPLTGFELMSGQGFSFDLLTVGTSGPRDDSALTLIGTGLFHLTGFDDTPGSFIFTANQAGDTFSFSASEATVPEPGSMLLLGTGLFGLAGAVRRRMKK